MIRDQSLMLRPAPVGWLGHFLAVAWAVAGLAMLGLAMIGLTEAQAAGVPLPREKPAIGTATGVPVPRPNPRRQALRRATPAFATGISIEANQGQTRFVLDLSGAVPYRIFTLADPYRVVIDFPEIGFDLPVRPETAAAGLVKAFRYGLFRPGNSRAVLDLNQPARIVARRMAPPGGGFQYRLILDLEPVSRLDFLATAGWPERPASVSPPAPLPLAKPENSVRLVVIDPGHGGIDPGASSPVAGLEKALALRYARTLAAELNRAEGIKAILTRDRDVFLALRQRVEFARARGADLFISIHADTLPSPAVSGASVYTLSENATDEEAAELAAGENRADVIAGVDLQDEEAAVASILINLAQRETNNRSIDFALLLIDDLRAITPVLPTGHRQAGFRVLKAPDIPSVLLELGFISNPRDAKRLASQEWQRKTARQVAASIVRWLTAEAP